jgi:hypothetical protein
MFGPSSLPPSVNPIHSSTAAQPQHKASPHIQVSPLTPPTLMFVRRWSCEARIALDVPRTDPQHPLFAGGEQSSGGRALRRILLTYAALPEAVPYCQARSILFVVAGKCTVCAVW